MCVCGIHTTELSCSPLVDDESKSADAEQEALLWNQTMKRPQRAVCVRTRMCVCVRRFCCVLFRVAYLYFFLESSICHGNWPQEAALSQHFFLLNFVWLNLSWKHRNVCYKNVAQRIVFVNTLGFLTMNRFSSSRLSPQWLQRCPVSAASPDHRCSGELAGAPRWSWVCVSGRTSGSVT